MKNLKNKLPLETNDDALDTFHDVAAVISCLGALLDGRTDLDAMTTRDHRPVKGLSLLLMMTSDTIVGLSERLEQERVNRIGHYEYMMTDEMKSFSRLTATRHGDTLRAILKRMKADVEAPNGDKLTNDELLSDIEIDAQMERTNRENLLKMMNDELGSSDFEASHNGKIGVN